MNDLLQSSLDKERELKARILELEAEISSVSLKH